MNGIQVFQDNSINFAVTISTDLSIVLSGYTPIMAIDFITGTTYVTGSTITAGETIFTVSNEINQVEPYTYEYEIFIEDDTDRYTIIQDSYSVIPSLVNQ